MQEDFNRRIDEVWEKNNEFMRKTMSFRDSIEQIDSKMKKKKTI